MPAFPQPRCRPVLFAKQMERLQDHRSIHTTTPTPDLEPLVIHPETTVSVQGKFAQVDCLSCVWHFSLCPSWVLPAEESGRVVDSIPRPSSGSPPAPPSQLESEFSFSRTYDFYECQSRAGESPLPVTPYKLPAESAATPRFGLPPPTRPVPFLGVNSRVGGPPSS